ncbi:DUF1631 domain-containing protein [Pseudomonas sp. N040]|uniref:DUF1631 domain-containing protein n=1 Tax=Pseudomonas sp. N040 TaxID=2785325 RepID=UPI0018A2A85C|nr:DUF1631 domain-containing protein [Pseudomonas sp. N040]MBF7730270.1 DUF1631 domain-containing protein [Pseudomonas sp. N040]MBW7013912.1 DUF1631 domain-containing protein [Pseudomonas sp. N040]
MQTDAKVVQLSSVAPDHPGASAVGRLPVALMSVGDKATQQLKQSLQALFDNADDTLFQMVDRADSNGEQNDFFEAMRDLRLKRKGIEQGFLNKVRENFAALNRVEIGRPPVLESISFDNLSLMNTDVLEETVAVDAMVTKALCANGVALGHLTTRFNALISRKLDDKNNPLGPAALCESFLAACSGLGVEIRVKLIIFKLFEKYVLSQLGELYAQSNQLLAEAGVLPDLKSAPPRKTQEARTADASVPAAGMTAVTPADGDQSSMQHAFGVLQELLSQVRGTALPQRAQPADAAPISSNDLMRLLSHLQQRLPADAAEADVRDHLDQLLVRASAKSGRARVVGRVDDDVINLVAMLFEFILDDRSLPDSLKALISRLQIPMLKVAVLDKTFFGRGSHPARRLLNEIASASLGWADQDDTRRDSLYLKIEQVVVRLLNEFVDDPAIFSELLADFIAFTGNERRRSDLLEQRTRDAEEGRAKAEVARLQVEQELNARLVGRTLPQVVVSLLHEAWSKVMLLACLKHGQDSAEWQGALQTMDDLIWSVEPHDGGAEVRLRLLQLVPNLLKSLRAGMADAALDPVADGDYFAQLEALHAQAFQGFRRDMPADLTGEGVADEPVSAVEALDAEVPDEFAKGDLAFVGMAMHLVAAAPPVMVEVLEEIVLLAPGEVRNTEPDIVLGVEDEALQRVDNLHVGSWVELQEAGERKLRCKLATVLKHSGKYIFVNRAGMKVLEKTRMGLAVEFRRGAVRLLDDALLFDRALESVIGNLRRLKGA